MLGEIRQQQMVDLIMQQKSIRIRELSDFFNVSEETIRRDLKRLEQEGLIHRTHGGAYVTDEVHPVPPIGQRSQEHVESKRSIAQKAASFVSDGSTIMLDNGTTTLEIARMIAMKNVTVITNDLTIAMELSTSPFVQLVVTGGTQQKGTYTLVGHECENTMRQYHVDFVFLGTGGISASQGLTTSSRAESEIKKLMIQNGNQVYCVADKSKFGKATLLSYARVSDVTGIITDMEQNDEILREFETKGANFIFA